MKLSCEESHSLSGETHGHSWMMIFITSSTERVPFIIDFFLCIDQRVSNDRVVVVYFQQLCDSDAGKIDDWLGKYFFHAWTERFSVHGEARVAPLFIICAGQWISNAITQCSCRASTIELNLPSRYQRRRSFDLHSASVSQRSTTLDEPIHPPERCPRVTFCTRRFGRSNDCPWDSSPSVRPSKMIHTASASRDTFSKQQHRRRASKGDVKNIVHRRCWSIVSNSIYWLDFA